MAAKIILTLCATALLVQAISASCGCSNSLINSGLLGFGNGLSGCAGNGYIGNSYGLGYGNIGLGNCGFGYGNIAASSGGALPVCSAGPIYPSGVSVLSENNIEGILTASGQLPFLSAVALEGQVPTAGSAVAEYGCGNGNVGIISEDVSAADFGAAYGLGYGSSLGYGSNLGYGSSLGYGSTFGGISGCSGIPRASYIARNSNCGCNRY